MLTNIDGTDYNMNQLAEATEQWENILLRDPQHPEALRNLKMANPLLEKIGRA